MYLAIDYGKKRIGLAIGTLIPKGAGTIDASSPREAILSKIKQVCNENEIEGIVIGLPLRSQGEAGTLDQEIRQFGRLIEDWTGLPIEFEEESFTSAEAESRVGNRRGARESGAIDETAAVILLEQYLGHQTKKG